MLKELKYEIGTSSRDQLPISPFHSPSTDLMPPEFLSWPSNPARPLVGNPVILRPPIVIPRPGLFRVSTRSRL
jgi:hypothetical protein